MNGKIVIEDINKQIDISPYDFPKKRDDSILKRLAIIHQTDVHGHLIGQQVETIDSKKTYKVGGYSTLSSIIEIIRDEHKQNTIILDSGDQFTGSLISQYFNGSVVTGSFNIEKVNLATLGNHEFDLGFDALKKRMKQSKFKYVSSNIVNNTNDSLFDQLTVNTSIIQVDDIRIGVIGLTTVQSYYTTSTNLSSITIDSAYSDITNQYADILKDKEQCDIVVVICHIGSQISNNDPDLYKLQMHDVDSKKNQLIRNEFTDFLDGLDNSLVNAVFGGHTHQMIHQFYNGIPVVVSQCYAKYTNIIYIDINRQTKQVQKTLIEGPVPICSQVFSQSKICDLNFKMNSEKKNGQLQYYSFHGKLVGDNYRLTEYYQKYVKILNDRFGKKQIGYVAQPCMRGVEEEGELQNLFSQMIEWKCQVDIGIVNKGCIRVDWPQGQLDYSLLFDTIPFTDQIVKISVNGKILKKIIRDLQEGEKKYYGISNVQVTILKNKVVKIRMFNHTRLQKIDNHKNYSIAMPDFLAFGGDDFNKVTKYFKIDPDQVEKCGDLRESTKEYIQMIKYVNTLQNPLVDPKKKHLIII